MSAPIGALSERLPLTRYEIRIFYAGAFGRNDHAVAGGLVGRQLRQRIRSLTTQVLNELSGFTLLLNESMVLAEDIRTTHDVLVAAKGQQVTLSVATLLRNYVGRHEIGDQVRVCQAGATAVKETAQSALTD